MEYGKTIAFMSLDSLVHLCRIEKQSLVLSALTRHGVLSILCKSEESDLRLQGVLKPDPGGSPVVVFNHHSPIPYR